jgi:hypothetical protein
MSSKKPADIGEGVWARQMGRELIPPFWMRQGGKAPDPISGPNPFPGQMPSLLAGSVTSRRSPCGRIRPSTSAEGENFSK